MKTITHIIYTAFAFWKTWCRSRVVRLAAGCCIALVLIFRTTDWRRLIRVAGDEAEKHAQA